MNKHLSVLSIFLLFISVSFSQQTISFYVSPSGSDNNSGSLKAPFATLEKAKQMVRKYRSSTPAPNAITVYLRKGEYFLDSTFFLYPEDSGDPDNPVTYCSYPGEKAVLIGGRRIGNWKRLNAQYPRVDPLARGKIWVADIPRGWLFHYLFVNGKKATRSQSDHRYWREWNKDHIPGKPDSKGQLVTFERNKEDLKYLPSNGDAEMVCMMAQYGIIGNGVVTGVDTVAGTLLWNSRSVNIRQSRNAAERGYRFENALHFIDRPGDWAVNSQTGKLYYYPLENENIRTAKVIAPRLYELIRLQGNETKQRYVHDIEIKDLELRYTDRLPENQWPYDMLMRYWEYPDAAIYLDGAEDCTFTGNTVLYSGSYGFDLHHFSKNNKLTGNEIGFSGSGGVLLEGYGPGTLDVNKENIISRNNIHDQGSGNYWSSPGIMIYQSGNNTVSYNLLQRSPYTAISIVGIDPGRMSDPSFYSPGTFEGQVQKWNMAEIRSDQFDPAIQDGLRKGTFKFDRETIKPYLHSNNNDIKYNIISEPMLLLNEGGAIYEWCPGKGNVWEYNVIFKSRGMPSSSVLALDDLSEYTTVENNYFWVEGPILDGVGCRKTERGNIIRNNYRMEYKPRLESIMDRDKIGSWWFNRTGREKMDSMLRAIKNTVKQNGGWLNNPKIGIPAAGERITKQGAPEQLPKGSHVTIE